MLSALNVSCQSRGNWFLANQIQAVSKGDWDAASRGMEIAEELAELEEV
jgi:hypothetical protein